MAYKIHHTDGSEPETLTDAATMEVDGFGDYVFRDGAGAIVATRKRAEVQRADRVAGD